MERFCVSHDCHRLGCDVEMVQSNVGEWVRYDDASAEIAKLRAEAEAVTKARDGACQQRDWWREQADAARAALDGEREALAVICDEQASLAKRDRCHAEAVTLHQIAVMIRARRAAEAQPISTCPIIGCGCDDPKRHDHDVRADAAEARP